MDALKWAFRQQEVTHPTDLLLLLTLVEYSPCSQLDDLCRAAKVSRATAFRSLGRLEKLGLVSREREDGRLKATKYILNRKEVEVNTVVESFDPVKFLLDALGAKRVKNKVQIEVVNEVYDRYGQEVYTQAVYWCARQGMTIGHTVNSLPKACATIAKGGSKRSPATGGNVTSNSNLDIIGKALDGK